MSTYIFNKIFMILAKYFDILRFELAFIIKAFFTLSFNFKFLKVFIYLRQDLQKKFTEFDVFNFFNVKKLLDLQLQVIERFQRLSLAFFTIKISFWT